MSTITEPTLPETEQRHDGGPAFPALNLAYSSEEGMSLRDWFAGQALITIAKVYQIAADHKIDVDINMDLIAKDAYKLADAMLKAREQ